MTKPANVHSIDAVSLRAYLVNVADTLRNAVVPELEGKALARGNECVTVVTRLAARVTAPNAAMAEFHDSSADAEGAALDAEEAEYHAVAASLVPSESSAQRRFDPDRLQTWLRGSDIGSPELAITESTVLQGGRSKLTVLISQSGGTKLPARFVVRQDWASSVTGTSVVQEFDILKCVYAAGICVPQPLLLESGSEALGAPFLLVGAVPGRGIGDLFDPPASETLALQLAEQLGHLHALGDAPFAELPGLAERGYTLAQLRAELASYRGVISQLGEPSVTLDLALDWIERNIKKVRGPRTLVHGDLGFHNFLVDGEKLTALLDWELAHLGHPAEDLGYARAWITKMLPWEQFLAAYHKAGGPDSGAFAIDFYTLWGGVRLYALLCQARAAIVGGFLRDCEIALCCAHLMPVLLHRMSRELRTILARG
ncbi:MAG: phosphotransferase family protein [Panacagrimonas sp.]